MVCKQHTLTDPTVPAVLIGIALGPIAAKFLDSDRWGSAEEGQTNHITLVRLPPSPILHS